MNRGQKEERQRVTLGPILAGLAGAAELFRIFSQQFTFAR
jgi:hypothetical protein